MNKRILLVAAAVVLALVGTIAVYSYGRSADSRAAANTKATSVLVASKRVAAGTSWAEAVKKKYLSVENMPSNAVPSSALADTASAAIGNDAVAQADIAPGQIVLREAFGTKSAQTGVLAIPKGLIAISVSMASNADVAGYVGPNSQVIVFVTANLNKKEAAVESIGLSKLITRTVVKRASVIAVSQAAPTTVAGANDGVSTAAAGGTVLLTLAVDQKTAERVILAQKVGELYLGLLSSSSKVSDDVGVENTGVFKPTQIFVK